MKNHFTCIYSIVGFFSSTCKQDLHPIVLLGHRKLVHSGVVPSHCEWASSLKYVGVSYSTIVGFEKL